MNQTDPTPFPPPLPADGPWPARRRSRNGLWGGAILVLVGVYFLLRNFGLLEWLRWDLFWPVVLIAAGFYLVIRRLR
jgi:hypothetical protein